MAFHMRRCCHLFLIAVLLECFATGSCRAEVDWHPQRTRVFAVGVLEWQHPDIWPGMAAAQRHRRDAQLVQHFKSVGVAEDRITYLQDRQATRHRIQKELTDQLSKTKPGELLVFYFTGHGFRDRKDHSVHFANYDAADGDSAWAVTSIFETLESNFHGSHVLLMADCCYSGGLVDVARVRKSRLNYACLCSSHSHNSSTGHWTFSDALLAGLRGSPKVDLNEDGEIDVGEVGQYSELEMAFVEGQKSVYDTAPEFSSRWRLSNPTQRKAPRQGERIEVKWKEKWYRAEILVTSGNQCKVHYIGFEDSWDEWVGPDRMRAFQPKNIDQGTAVEVFYHKDQKWYPARVVRSWYGLAFVHYDGFSSEWDDWVGPELIRMPGQKK